MDYEKKYNGALERAKNYYSTTDSVADTELIELIFPELKEKEMGEKIKRCLINGMKFYYEEDEKAVWGTEKFSMKVKDIIAWLEKQGEQKPVDKIEPKFKVGDWVIDKQGIVHQIANVIEIVTCHTYGYDVVGGGYFNDNTEGVRLWTIQDAKDGDVLKEDSCTFIIERMKPDGTAIVYCCLFDDGDFDGDFGLGSTLSFDVDSTYPATKEQRDTLMKAITDAGYEWDAEKKELKLLVTNGGDFESENCEQKSAWSYEDEANLNNIIWLCNNCIKGSETTWIPAQAKKIKHLIETIKERGLLQQNPIEWSEEDSPYYDDICEILINLLRSETANVNKTAVQKDLDWLKSLKDRYTWRPSDEQMDALETLYDNLKRL